MTTPYHARIMIAPAHSPNERIEFARFRRRVSPKDIASHILELSSFWICSIERPTNSNRLRYESHIST